MNDDPEIQSFEEELRCLRPARPDPELLRRVGDAVQLGERRGTGEPGHAHRGSWLAVFRWFLPASASALAVVLLTSRVWHGRPAGVSAAAGGKPPPAIQADEVHINRQLVASFETVAEAPDGLPIRFQLQEWSDRVIFQDTRRGITVERTSPRVEIVPVGYESY